MIHHLSLLLLFIYHCLSGYPRVKLLRSSVLLPCSNVYQSQVLPILFIHSFLQSPLLSFLVIMPSSELFQQPPHLCSWVLPQSTGNTSLVLPELPRYSRALIIPLLYLEKQPTNQPTSYCLNRAQTFEFTFKKPPWHKVNLCSRHVLYNDPAKHTYHCYVHLLHTPYLHA